MLVLYALALACGGGLRLHLLHEAEGATELNEPPWVLHWPGGAGLALPLVCVGVWMSSRPAARLVQRDTSLAPRELLGALPPASMALYASIILAAANPLHGVLFAAQHDGHDLPLILPLILHVLRDGLVALTGNLVVAALLVVCASWRPRIVVSPSRFARGGLPC